MLKEGVRLQAIGQSRLNSGHLPAEACRSDCCHLSEFSPDAHSRIELQRSMPRLSMRSRKHRTGCSQRKTAQKRMLLRRSSAIGSTPRIFPDPDMLIRTSGEISTVEFLLWQLSYTEIHVTSKLWPDFP